MIRKNAAKVTLVKEKSLWYQYRKVENWLKQKVLVKIGKLKSSLGKIVI